MLILLIGVLGLSGCARAESSAVVVSKLHNCDAKFFHGRVWTSVDGHLVSLDLHGKDRRDYDIRTNWIAGIDEENVLVYGNNAGQIGLVRFDKDNNVACHDIICHCRNLLIDPAITASDDGYYMTVTEIKGNVNNDDPSKENGDYILHLFASKDLQKWEHVSDVVREHHNIEDVDIIAEDKCLCCVYEKEVIDKGLSSVCLKKSVDRGRTWSDEKVLLQADADQEPACFEKEDGGYSLLYSSDLEAPGRSYMGARAYQALFDGDFNVKKPGQMLHTCTKEGILLYDRARIGGKNYILYARNYLTDCDLVIEVETGGL